MRPSARLPTWLPTIATADSDDEASGDDACGDDDEDSNAAESGPRAT